MTTIKRGSQSNNQQACLPMRRFTDSLLPSIRPLVAAILLQPLAWILIFLAGTGSGKAIAGCTVQQAIGEEDLSQEVASPEKEQKVQFARDVLPVLSNSCFKCHGPDDQTREAGLRLDDRQLAIELLAIVPGEPEASEIIARMESAESDCMPPSGSGVPALTAEQISTIKKWINQGAQWQQHWSFVSVQRPTPPTIDPTKYADRTINPIDQFVLDQLEQRNVSPAKVADKRTLARRTSLLITGLPIRQDWLEEYLANQSAGAYEQLIDRLLDSPAFGERMAAQWMDLARYSDTDGFQGDEPRTNWPWRDWVIEAYNNGMPFDQFTIEQFAGDLLPNATDRQILATCFHRNHMTNGEGGRDPEESRVDYVLDRVNTMGTAWLGLTLGCAQCHTHKYDPITQKDYYRLSAFFNSIDEDGRAGRNRQKPYLAWQLPDAELLLNNQKSELVRRQSQLNKELVAARNRAEKLLAEILENRKARLAAVGSADWKNWQISSVRATSPKVNFVPDGQDIWVNGKGNPNVDTFTLTGPIPANGFASIRIQALPHPSFTNGGLSKSDSGNFVLTDVVATILRQPTQSAAQDQQQRIPVKLNYAWADYSQPGFPVNHAIDSKIDTGWAVLSGDMTQPRTCVVSTDSTTIVQPDDQLEIQLVHYSHHPGHNIGRFRISTSVRPQAAHATDLDKRLASIANDDELPRGRRREQLIQYLIDRDGKAGLAKARVNAAQKKLDRVRSQNTVPVMVLKERKNPRQSHVLERGVWDAHGDPVKRATPVSLAPKLPESVDNTRLDLARWLVDRQNPLTARVAVNRYWQMYFGQGLVRTPQDFGLQGQQPTHPQLLDWLAAEFMDSGWNVKRIHKLILMSSTFRQSSVFRQDLFHSDPENRWLARGPRFRMPAAMIRDQALAVSGLINEQRGGPPVKPYQPDNVWSASDQGRYPYVTSTGRNLYRRSLYTYWRRNIAPPGLFDAAQRRVCEVVVRRTNSPMHALNLLNDVTYIESARVLASTLLAEKTHKTESDLVDQLIRRILNRPATKLEISTLTNSLTQLQREYQDNPELAKQLLNQGATELDARIPAARMAALTIVASTVLNLDETLNIE